MRTPQGSAGTSPGQLINPRERWLYGLMVAVSLVVYAGLVLVGLGDPKAASMIVFYGLVFALVALFGHGLALGRVRGNSVRVSERQFPQLHRLAAAPYLVFGLLLGASLWYVSRRLFGNAGGYVALALYCFSPGIVRSSAIWWAEPEIGAAWGVKERVPTGGTRSRPSSKPESRTPGPRAPIG